MQKFKVTDENIDDIDNEGSNYFIYRGKSKLELGYVRLVGKTKSRVINLYANVFTLVRMLPEFGFDPTIMLEVGDVSGYDEVTILKFIV